MHKLNLAALAMTLAGCTASTIDEPFSTQLSNGQPGYRMLGAVNYTSSVTEARQVVQDKMDEACGGKATLIRFDPNPDLSGPFDVVNFEAWATCAP
jgi:hypothetical protein